MRQLEEVDIEIRDAVVDLERLEPRLRARAAEALLTDIGRIRDDDVEATARERGGKRGAPVERQRIGLAKWRLPFGCSEIGCSEVERSRSRIEGDRAVRLGQCELVDIDARDAGGSDERASRVAIRLRAQAFAEPGSDEVLGEVRDDLDEERAGAGRGIADAEREELGRRAAFDERCEREPGHRARDLGRRVDHPEGLRGGARRRHAASARDRQGHDEAAAVVHAVQRAAVAREDERREREQIGRRRTRARDG